MESTNNKSRSLSTYQFFQILQLEWIIADLRVRIYPHKKDKEYWNRVKEGKQRKIEEIAQKNVLPTIFDDAEMKVLFEQKVYKVKGCAEFTYKNETDKQLQEPLDLLYYYSKDAEVRFEVYGEQKIGTVKKYNQYTKIVTVTDAQAQEYSVATAEVTRIL